VRDLMQWRDEGDEIGTRNIKLGVGGGNSAFAGSRASAWSARLALLANTRLASYIARVSVGGSSAACVARPWTMEFASLVALPREVVGPVLFAPFARFAPAGGGGWGGAVLVHASMITRRIDLWEAWSRCTYLRASTRRTITPRRLNAAKA
jgi:hypothetical protein